MSKVILPMELEPLEPEQQLLDHEKLCSGRTIPCGPKLVQCPECGLLLTWLDYPWQMIPYEP